MEEFLSYYKKLKHSDASAETPENFDENFVGDVISFLGSKIPDNAFEKIITKIVHDEAMMNRIIDHIFSTKSLLSKVMDEMERKILSK